MLVYSYQDISIYFDRNDETPYKLEIREEKLGFHTLEELLSFLRQGKYNEYWVRMVEEKIHVKISGCSHFPGRKCRGCSYSSDPMLYDGFCLYGRDEELNLVDEAIN